MSFLRKILNPQSQSHNNLHSDRFSQYEDMFENAPIGIFKTTVEGNYISANPKLAEIYGYESPKELMETLTNIELQLYINPIRRFEFFDELIKHNFVTDFESEIRRKDGTIIWISESARLVSNADGEPLYFEGFIKNINERIMLQHKYSELTESLERRIEERTEELNQEAEKRRLVEFKLRQALKEARQRN